MNNLILSSKRNDTTMTSLELRDMINSCREAYGEVHIRNTHFIERIEDELSGELPVAKKWQPTRGGTPQRYYDLSEDQILLVGMRESKHVRRMVLQKMKEILKPSIGFISVRHMWNELTGRKTRQLPKPLRDSVAIFKKAYPEAFHKDGDDLMVVSTLALGIFEQMFQHRQDTFDKQDAMGVAPDEEAWLRLIEKRDELKARLDAMGGSTLLLA